MAEPKTKPTDEDPRDFIAQRAPENRRDDAYVLIDLLQEITGEKATMWGDAIIGFGRYSYTNSTKKPQIWPLLAFSPRKADMTIYIMPGMEAYESLIAQLGKCKTKGVCLHIKKLSDINRDVLSTLCLKSYEAMKARYT